jgi:hypothetical protein
LHQALELLVVVLGDDRALSRQVQLMLFDDVFAYILHVKVLLSEFFLFLLSV